MLLATGSNRPKRTTFANFASLSVSIFLLERIEIKIYFQKIWVTHILNVLSPKYK